MFSALSKCPICSYGNAGPALTHTYAHAFEIREPMQASSDTKSLHAHMYITAFNADQRRFRDIVALICDAFISLLSANA